MSGQSFIQLEEIDIDFIDLRVPGLSHAVVKNAEKFRVQELVKKIESHPPFSNKAMIREMAM